jgi:hypothetical protein
MSGRYNMHRQLLSRDQVNEETLSSKTDYHVFLGLEISAKWFIWKCINKATGAKSSAFYLESFRIEDFQVFAEFTAFLAVTLAFSVLKYKWLPFPCITL